MRLRLQYWVSRWTRFKYNFSWHSYVGFLDGWLAKSALAVPLVGYLIIFNDSVAHHLKFETLTGVASAGMLSTSMRLKFAYLGLLLLGSANFLYYLRRPQALSIGKDQFSFVEGAFNHFTIHDYVRINDAVHSHGHCTLHGNYDSNTFDGFFHLAHSTSNNLKNATPNWRAAKNAYEGLLRSMLIEDFHRRNRLNRGSLAACILLALTGYALLLVPSADLFFRVMAVIIAPILA